MLPFRDTELRSSAGSLTGMSHSGRRPTRRRLAAYPAVNSPMIAVSPTNACSSAAGSPAGRSAASSPWPRRASPACGNGSAWTWPNCGPRLAHVVAEAGQEGFELAGLAFREVGAQSLVEGNGGVAQGRPLRDDDSPAASPWPPGRPGLDEGPPAQGRRPGRPGRCRPTRPAGRGLRAAVRRRTPTRPRGAMTKARRSQPCLHRHMRTAAGRDSRSATDACRDAGRGGRRGRRQPGVRAGR